MPGKCRLLPEKQGLELPACQGGLGGVGHLGEIGHQRGGLFFRVILACGITDTPVLMAAKAHLRNGKPLVISVSTNDALGINFKNIGELFNTKNIYFVPFGQDDPAKKPNSMIARTELIEDTLKEALEGRQIQPVIRGHQ